METYVTPVKTKREMRRFIRFPWKIYRGNTAWVPPLISEQKAMFDRMKFPFFEHSEVEFFLAYRNRRVVGRIAAICNNNHLKIYHDETGFFGFFESIDDQSVADALFIAAEDWLKRHGLKRVRGPENYSQNEECGLLIDAFDKPPVMMMTYNPPYYPKLIEAAGFKKAIDMYAYAIEGADKVPERLASAVAEIRKNADFTVRNIDLNKLDEEVELIKKVYNAAWSENWGAVPFTDSEVEHLKNALKQIVIPEMVFIAEIEGEPVGVSLTAPDINQALIHLNGRLFPIGIFKLLWYSRRINKARVIIMGVMKEHRHKGIDTLFYYETFHNGLKHGFNCGEMSWILENNAPMRRALEKIYGTKIDKTYRIFEKPIG